MDFSSTTGKSGYSVNCLRKALLFIVVFAIFHTVLFSAYYIDDRLGRDPLRIPIQQISPVTRKQLQNTIPVSEIIFAEEKFAKELTLWHAAATTPKTPIDKRIQIYDKKSIVQNKTLEHLITDNKWTRFRFHINKDMVDLVRRYKENGGVEEKPVFPYLYNFTFANIIRCSSHDLLFIFLVKSAVGNFNRRNAIRTTWANDFELKQHNAIRKFLVGMSNNQLTFSVKKENEIHNDIIQMSFTDNYYNNTLKTIGGIHWVAKYCNRTKFVVMVDDDMFVATPRVSQYLKVNISANTSYYGGFVTNHDPNRDNSSKWYVSKEDYPYDVYPMMPSGGFTIMSMPFVIDVHITSQYTKKFIFDDCYMGILAYRLRVEPTHIPRLVMQIVKPRGRYFKTILAAHIDT